MDLTAPVLDVTAANGVPFRVVLTAADKPLVEFFDRRYPHTEHGQFVSRYYVDTLLYDTALRFGLMLDGGVPNWRIDGHTMLLVVNWLQHHVRGPHE